MALSVGILGLPNVGKSTLFKALTKNPVDISNYPFCTVEPNVGIVKVPDERLAKLVEVSKPEKTVPSVVKFVDVAGLVRGAHKGEGLGNQFLAHLRECDALLHIVRCFRAENIAHIDGQINPQRDIETVESELILKDLETLDNRLGKLEKDIKKGDEEAQKEVQLLNSLREKLIQNEPACHFLQGLEDEKKEMVKNFFLLTVKPQIYLLNCKEAEVSENLIKTLKEKGKEWLRLDLRDELDKSEWSAEERKELDLEESQLDELIKKCYSLLKLITFFTIVGKEENRAWPIEKGSSVLEGAEMVHSDFKEKFVRAEVINWRRLVDAGGWKRAQELGLTKTVGKDYILEDGDVIEIKI